MQELIKEIEERIEAREKIIQQCNQLGQYKNEINNRFVLIGIEEALKIIKKHNER